VRVRVRVRVYLYNHSLLLCCARCEGVRKNYILYEMRVKYHRRANENTDHHL